MVKLGHQVTMGHQVRLDMIKDSKILSLPLEEKDGKVKILCPYCGPGIVHDPPCDGGWIWVDKEKFKNKLWEKQANLR